MAAVAARWQFLDRGDRWAQIDDEIRRAVQAAWEVLQTEWDRIHPDNPVLKERADAADDQENEEGNE